MSGDGVYLPALNNFQGKETEHNWAARDRAITRVRGMLKGDVYLRYPDSFLASLKEGFIQWSLKTVGNPIYNIHLADYFSAGKSSNDGRE